MKRLKVLGFFFLAINVPALTAAQQLSIPTTGIASVQIENSQDAVDIVTIPTTDPIAVSFPDNCEIISQEKIRVSGSVAYVDLSFDHPTPRPSSTSSCRTKIAVPQTLAISVSASNDNVSFSGRAASLHIETKNGSIALSNTFETPINAASSNGNISVTNATAALILQSTNGAVIVSSSSGSFSITGANNSVTISDYLFSPASKSTIAAVNGTIKTSKLSTQKYRNKKLGLRTRVRAFKSIKFPQEREFSSFPGKSWLSRTLIKGKSAALLIIDAKRGNKVIVK